MANSSSIWLGSWSRRNRINVELNGVWIIHRLHVQIFSDHLKEFQFPIYKNCFGRIDKQEQICSQKCLSKRFSKVGNKSEVNRLGVKIVAANWCLDLCSVTSLIARRSAQDTRRHHCRHRHHCFGYYCYRQHHQQSQFIHRQHVMVVAIFNVIILGCTSRTVVWWLRPRPLSLLLLTKTYLDVVSKGKGNIVITYIKILKKTWRKYNQQQENQLTLKVYSLTYRLLPPLRVIK